MEASEAKGYRIPRQASQFFGEVGFHRFTVGIEGVDLVSVAPAVKDAPVVGVAYDRCVDEAS